MNELTKFENLVLRMRKQQNDYFRSRNKNTLIYCKKLEKEVDDHIINKISPGLWN